MEHYDNDEDAEKERHLLDKIFVISSIKSLPFRQWKPSKSGKK